MGSLRLYAKDALVSYLPALNWPVSKKEVVGVIFMLALLTLFLQRRWRLGQEPAGLVPSWKVIGLLVVHCSNPTRAIN